MIALSAASASLCGQTDGALLDAVEDDTDRWIELQAALSKERATWRAEKELLLNSRRILNTEKGIVEKSLESNRLASELYVKNEAALREKIDQQKAALEVVAQSLSAYRAKMDSIVARLPEPIREEVESQMEKLNPGQGESSVSVAGRMQSLISILTMIDQFNNSLTLTHQIREGADGQSFDTRVLYWGLAVGFAVDRAGESAWKLIPSENGWIWEDASSEAESIQTLLDVYENDQRPTLVSLKAILN